MDESLVWARAQAGARGIGTRRGLCQPLAEPVCGSVCSRAAKLKTVQNGYWTHDAALTANLEANQVRRPPLLTLIPYLYLGSMQERSSRQGR